MLLDASEYRGYHNFRSNLKTHHNTSRAQKINESEPERVSMKLNVLPDPVFGR